MKTIAIDGIIGWDVSAADVRQAIREARGEDLTIEVNSPGGSVTEGIAIYNAIRNAPGAKTTRIVGLAASMGSYIALAAERVTAEANAIYMIHNAGMIAMGDHNALRKAADIAEGMSKILAAAYVEKTGKAAEDIRAMMDSETFLYGQEIADAGFADEIIGQAGEGDDKAAAILRTRAAVASADDLIKRASIDADTDQAAALLAEILPKPAPAAAAAPAPKIENTAGVAGEKAAGPKDKKGVKNMTIDQIKAEAPEIAAALRDEGVQAERKRVAALAAFRGINADGDKAVEEAIAAGKDYADVAPIIAAAVAKGQGKQADGENAPGVGSSTATTGANASLDDIDAEAMKLFGIAPEEYRKHKREGK